MELSFFSLFNKGITLSGLEQALTVGQSATINCTTNIEVSSIVWRRNQSSTVLSSTESMSGGTHTMLEYTFDPVFDELQGQKYSCTAKAADGTEYTEAVQIEVVGKSVIKHSVLQYHTFTLQCLYVHASFPLWQFPLALLRWRRRWCQVRVQWRLAMEASL